MKTKLAYLILLVVLTCSACKNNNVYSDLLKEERKLIESYIQRQGITVVTEEPTEWGEKVYWQVPDADNFYFHLVARGDTTQAELEANEDVLLRFNRYTLNDPADTIYNWTILDNPNPVKLQYMVSTEQSCTGWQIALKYMKYTDSQCKIICPSKLGFGEENSAVIPYGYDLKIKIKRY